MIDSTCFGSGPVKGQYVVETLCWMVSDAGVLPSLEHRLSRTLHAAFPKLALQMTDLVEVVRPLAFKGRKLAHPIQRVVARSAF